MTIMMILIFILARLGEAFCKTLEGDTHVTMEHQVLAGHMLLVMTESCIVHCPYRVTKAPFSCAVLYSLNELKGKISACRQPFY